jgi:hypothetical protein
MFLGSNGLAYCCRTTMTKGESILYYPLGDVSIKPFARAFGTTPLGRKAFGRKSFRRRLIWRTRCLVDATMVVSFRWNREYWRGKYYCTIHLLFDWFGISCMTTDNFFKTDLYKPVKQEVNGTVILPPLGFPGWKLVRTILNCLICLHDCTVCMAALSAWPHSLHGRTVCMAAQSAWPQSAWLHCLHGCTDCIAAQSAWPYSLYGCMAA